MNLWKQNLSNFSLAFKEPQSKTCTTKNKRKLENIVK